MLDKLGLNNQLLKKKKVVQQARIQIVNRLVQKIRRTKLLTEKHTENNKLRKKLNNQLEILSHIKKFNRFEVLKNAVLNETEPTAILTNGNIKPDQKALAHFYQHPLVKDAVKSLREQFHLERGDTSWQKELRELGKRKKKAKEKAAAVKSKGLNWIEEDITEEPSTEKSTVNAFKDKKPKNLDKKQSKKDDQDQKKTSVSKKIETPSSEKKIPMQQSVDPFFITSQGDNYLATVVKETVIANNSDDKQKAFKAILPKKGNIKSRFDKNQSGNFKSKDKFGRNDRNNSKFNKTSNDKKPWDKTKRMPESSEGLHPSWAAKQKLKPVITKFSGKKTVFGNEMAPGSETSSNVTKLSTETDEKLHPSWAAKQKLKPVITEFKGKKIVFDDD